MTESVRIDGRGKAAGIAPDGSSQAARGSCPRAPFRAAERFYSVVRAGDAPPGCSMSRSYVSLDSPSRRPARGFPSTLRPISGKSNDPGDDFPEMTISVISGERVKKAGGDFPRPTLRFWLTARLSIAHVAGIPVRRILPFQSARAEAAPPGTLMVLVFAMLVSVSPARPDRATPIRYCRFRANATPRTTLSREVRSVSLRRTR